MTKHLERDIESLEQELLAMSARVEGMIEKAWLAFTEKIEGLAEEVIELDELVNQREVRIEEECLKILALHQPVAIDLRRTATILKVNNDLERIADLAVNLAERAQRLIRRDAFPIPKELNRMAEVAKLMVRDALNSFVNLNYNDAVEVCKTDDKVDDDHDAVIGLLRDQMRANSDDIETAIHYLMAARCLERIADHATNVAEDVLYLIKGDIARHRPIEFTSNPI